MEQSHQLACSDPIRVQDLLATLLLDSVIGLVHVHLPELLCVSFVHFLALLTSSHATAYFTFILCILALVQSLLNSLALEAQKSQPSFWPADNRSVSAKRFTTQADAAPSQEILVTGHTSPKEEDTLTPCCVVLRDHSFIVRSSGLTHGGVEEHSSTPEKVAC